MPTTTLNDDARRALRAAGIDPEQWTVTYGGDRCGCFDDRCIGHHHEADEPCACLPVCIRQHRDETADSLPPLTEEYCKDWTITEFYRACEIRGLPMSQVATSWEPGAKQVTRDYFCGKQVCVYALPGLSPECRYLITRDQARTPDDLDRFAAELITAARAWRGALEAQATK